MFTFFVSPPVTSMLTSDLFRELFFTNQTSAKYKLSHYNGQVASMTLEPRLFKPLCNDYQGAANPNLRVVAD